MAQEDKNRKCKCDAIFQLHDILLLPRSVITASLLILNDALSMSPSTVHRSEGILIKFFFYPAKPHPLHFNNTFLVVLHLHHIGSNSYSLSMSTHGICRRCGRTFSVSGLEHVYRLILIPSSSSSSPDRIRICHGSVVSLDSAIELTIIMMIIINWTGFLGDEDTIIFLLSSQVNG